jgi:hypothetical protein
MSAPHYTTEQLQNELRETLEGMLGNYLELKRLSLIAARSDRPNWMPGMTEEDDCHVIRARAILAKVPVPVRDKFDL